MNWTPIYSMLVVDLIVEVFIVENCISSWIVILLVFLSTAQSFIITLVVVFSFFGENFSSCKQGRQFQ